MREFCESEVMRESARGQWDDGMDSLRLLRSKMLDMMADSETGDPVVRIAAAFNDAFEAVDWKAQEHRFVALIGETMENAGGGHNSTARLATVKVKIAELAGRLQELRAEQQELSQLHELSVTVSNLAWNVTSDTVRGTFEQVTALWW